MEYAPRIAYVVANDVFRDSRVLKTADSAAAHGFAVRIYAFGGPLSHFPAGVESRDSGVEIHRLPVLPDRARAVGALLRRFRRTPAVDGRTTQPPSAGSTSRVLGREAVRRVAAVFVRVGLRAGGALRAADFQRAATRAIVQWRPALVHAHDANTLEIAMAVQRKTLAPFVYDAHELWEERNARRGGWARAAERRLLDRATSRMAGSVTVSPSIQRWMTDRYGLAAPPVLVRNIPRAQPMPMPERGRLRELASLGADQRIVAYIGGITTGRGIEQAIAAIATLGDDIHLVLLGHGSPTNIATFVRLAERTGVADRVHFAGSVESAEVSAAAADADVSLVFTQPKNLSYRYSLPNKLFESIHAGLPIVASDLPDVAELVGQYDLGALSDPEDVNALAAAIVRVLDEPERHRGGVRAAARELNWESEMIRLMALYDGILNEQEQRR